MTREDAALAGTTRIVLVGTTAATDAVAEALSNAFDDASLVRERDVDGALDSGLEGVGCLVCEGRTSADLVGIERLRGRRSDVPLVATVDRAGAEPALEAGATDVLDPAAPDAVVAARVRSATRGERRRRDATAASRAGRSERLHRWSRSLDDLERTLLASTTRDEVERRLCEGIRDRGTPERDAVELVWVGGTSPGTETLENRAVAGPDDGLLEGLEVRVAEGSPDPAGRAAATGAPVVVDDVAAATGGDAGERWRRGLLDRGLRSVLGVPLASADTPWGAVAAYAAEPGAFDREVERSYEHLATVAGFAVDAAETKRSLLSNTVTELEVILRDASSSLPALARALGARVDVASVVPRSSGGATVFCSVAATADAVRAATVGGVESVDAVRLLETGSETTLLEARVAAEPVAEAVADFDGVVRSVTPTNGGVRGILELPNAAAVRPALGSLERVDPGIELVARSERDRPLGTAGGVHVALGDVLTERQRRTLEAAYYGGFFERPRESTGEQIADALGVSQPTFSRRVRTAQRNLLSRLVDDSRGSE